MAARVPVSPPPSYTASASVALRVQPADSHAATAVAVAVATKAVKGRGGGHYYWQHWPARIQPFGCFGHVVLLARDRGMLATTVLLIVLNASLFLAFVARQVHPAVTAFGALFTALPLALLVATTFTEAGIVPRKNLSDYTPQQPQGQFIPTSNG